MLAQNTSRPGETLKSKELLSQNDPKTEENTPQTNEASQNPENPAESVKPEDGNAQGNQNSAQGENQEPAKPVNQPPAIYYNQAMQNAVNEQLRWTPADPSFLYETRYIPEHKNDQEFLPSALEKVVIKEKIKEEANFRKSLGKIKIRLPDMTQSLAIAIIVFFVLLYRSRAKKEAKGRK